MIFITNELLHTMTAAYQIGKLLSISWPINYVPSPSPLIEQQPLTSSCASSPGSTKMVAASNKAKHLLNYKANVWPCCWQIQHHYYSGVEFALRYCVSV